MKPITIILLLLSCISCSSTALEKALQDRITQPVPLSALVQYESLLPNVYQKPKAELIGELQALAGTYPRLLEIQQHTELLETHQFDALSRLTQVQEEILSNSPSRGAVWDLQQLYFTFTVSNPKFSKYFEAWIQHEPNNPTPWIARGLHRRIQGKRVLSHNPTNETLVARLEAKKAFMQAAEQDLLHAIAINPNNPLARGYLKSVTRTLDLNGKLFMQEPAEVLARLRKKNKAIYESSEEAYKTQSKWVASKANRIPALLETIDDMAGYEQECVGLSSFLLLRGIPHDLSPRARCLYNQQKYAEAKEVLEEILATSSKPNKWATEKLQAVNERLNGI